MYGRYGSDTLNKVLTGVYIGWVVLYSILSLWVNSTIYSLVYILVTIALIFAIFGRMFSRNIEKRRRENQKFCGFFKLRRNKFRDRKTHVYYKCPRCKAMLRLPRAKGKHTVICPRCQNRFPVKK
jgi:DNA-directed RNA polymerase subunit RPC12/RpoP